MTGAEFSSHLEIELKFDLTAHDHLPTAEQWAQIEGVNGVGAARVLNLDAQYFDTADFRLLRARHTMRRRAGGDDSGWHVKRPASGAWAARGGRSEEHFPIGRSAVVPVAVRDAVFAVTRGAPLRPVVRLATVRTVQVLHSGEHGALVEIADDTVTATVRVAGKAVTIAWRELEAEWIGPIAAEDLRDALLAAVAGVLRAGGAAPSPWASKLGRAVSTALPEVDLGADPEPAELADRAGLDPHSAGAAALSYFAARIGDLVSFDPAVRRDAPDAVHQMRVTTRRLRSALAAFAPLMRGKKPEALVPTWIAGLRSELGWLADLLGAPRDAEVIRDELASLFAAELPEVLDEVALARVRSTLDERHRLAHGALVSGLRSDRYRALLEDLDLLVRADIWGRRGRLPARQVLGPILAKSFSRTARCAGLAQAIGPSEAAYEPALHEVRKAAKRTRYTADALLDVLGHPVRRFTRRLGEVQEVLGTLQDAVVIRQELATLAQLATAAGESTFAYGRLHGLQQARAERAIAAFSSAWARAEGAADLLEHS